MTSGPYYTIVECTSSRDVVYHVTLRPSSSVCGSI